MYKSPVEIIYGQMRTSVENDVVKAVMDVGINVDKDELIRALQYDRGQYEKGYQDAVHGKDLVELVRCKDCKWHNTDEDECWLSGLDTDGYEFCSWAERKEL